MFDCALDQKILIVLRRIALEDNRFVSDVCMQTRWLSSMTAIINIQCHYHGQSQITFKATHVGHPNYHGVIRTHHGLLFTYGQI